MAEMLQGLVELLAPERRLTRPELELCELPDPHLYCGSAGSYNLDQPQIASFLGQKKATRSPGYPSSIIPDQYSWARTALSLSSPTGIILRPLQSSRVSIA
jgi:hypothetical protein